jgi:hypothetical protein
MLPMRRYPLIVPGSRPARRRPRAPLSLEPLSDRTLLSLGGLVSSVLNLVPAVLDLPGLVSTTPTPTSSSTPVGVTVQTPVASATVQTSPVSATLQTPAATGTAQSPPLNSSSETSVAVGVETLTSSAPVAVSVQATVAPSQQQPAADGVASQPAPVASSDASASSAASGAGSVRTPSSGRSSVAASVLSPEAAPSAASSAPTATPSGEVLDLPAGAGAGGFALANANAESGASRLDDADVKAARLDAPLTVQGSGADAPADPPAVADGDREVAVGEETPAGPKESVPTDADRGLAALEDGVPALVGSFFAVRKVAGEAPAATPAGGVGRFVVGLDAAPAAGRAAASPASEQPSPAIADAAFQSLGVSMTGGEGWGESVWVKGVVGAVLAAGLLQAAVVVHRARRARQAAGAADQSAA